jgi:hypothetical protein
MAKKYIVMLTDEERNALRKLASSGKGAARKLTHARILLKADEAKGAPAWTDVDISRGIDVGTATVERVRKRFVEEGLDAALNRCMPKRVYRRKLDGEGEAQLIATTCSEPPEGSARWTLRLIADRMVELGVVDSIARETVRQAMKKTS